MTNETITIPTPPTPTHVKPFDLEVLDRTVRVRPHFPAYYPHPNLRCYLQAFECTVRIDGRQYDWTEFFDPSIKPEHLGMFLRAAVDFFERSISAYPTVVLQAATRNGERIQVGW